MVVSIPHPGVPSNSITSPHLRSAMFGNLDKNHFVKEFIESQKHHATSYAADGKDLLATWDRQNPETPEKGKASASPAEDFGFDTPVLKPRAAKPRYESVDDIPDADTTDVADKNMRRRKSSRPESKHKNRAVAEPIKSDKENMRYPPIPKGKTTSKKRPILVDSGDEHAARECPPIIYKGIEIQRLSIYHRTYRAARQEACKARDCSTERIESA